VTITRTPELERVARRRRKRRAPPRGAVVAAAALLVFLLGVAVGEALHDNPHPGRSQTIVRTLPPPTG
jgi:hypothetical protein